MISIIVAMDKNMLIGANGKIPWNIPEDLKLFKKITTDGIVIMGRKTFDSIGFPLPNRINIVLSKTQILGQESIFSFKDYIEALNFAKKISKEKNKEIFIIGGSKIYELYLPLVDKLYISAIEGIYQGDTYFPKFDISNFKISNEIKFKNFIFKEFLKK